MEWQQLKYFQCIAKTEHIGEASKLLYVTQPAISMAIKKLEAELGVSLFDRDKKNIRLNKYGRAYLKHVEAAMQVAHAVSTHRVMLESDYFTAMDDLLTGDSMESSGSSMIGDTDYNSACYYIYAAIDADALRENLRYGEAPDVLVAKAIPALLQAMAFSNPSGKQNSFAGHVLPSAVLVECKERKIPVSYVNAYVEPARATGTEDLVKNSLTKLVEECNMTTRAFELPVQKRLWFCLEKYAVQAPAQAEICQSFSQLLDAVQETLK